MIPEGDYEARAVTIDHEQYGPIWAQFGQTESGNDQVAVLFEIQAGPFKGQRLTWIGYFSEKTKVRTIESLRYMGFKGDDLFAAMEQPLDQPVQIVVKHEEYKGKTQVRINYVNPPGGRGGMKLKKPTDRSGIDALSARLRGDLRSVPEHTAAAPATNGTTPFDDDPIPFR